MRHYIIKTICFISPFLLILISYFFTDPYKVLYQYDNYYPTDGTPKYIDLNRSMVTVETFIANNSKYHYDSFIFGNSRSGLYRIGDWKKYIGEDASCFHMDEYGGSIYMIDKKIRYITQKTTIKNAIICLDDWTLSTFSPQETNLHRCPPVLNEYRNVVKFHLGYIADYFSPYFFPQYWSWRLTGRVFPYAKDVISEKAFYWNYETNECQRDSEVYQDNCWIDSEIFSVEDFSGDCERYDDLISREVEMLLRDISEILNSQRADYYVIINPTLSRKKLSINDISILNEIYGDRLYDFSGNNIITRDSTLFLDDNHFNSNVAAKIMEIVYSQNN